MLSREKVPEGPSVFHAVCRRAGPTVRPPMFHPTLPRRENESGGGGGGATETASGGSN